VSWNYRIVRYKNGSGFGLHEVYYDANGDAWGMTSDPAGFTCDLDEGPKSIVEQLLTARVDARKRPVFDEPETWPGKAP
jgi:hypothetical protein